MKWRGSPSDVCDHFGRHRSPVSHSRIFRRRRGLEMLKLRRCGFDCGTATSSPIGMLWGPARQQQCGGAGASCVGPRAGCVPVVTAQPGSGQPGATGRGSGSRTRPVWIFWERSGARPPARPAVRQPNAFARCLSRGHSGFNCGWVRKEKVKGRGFGSRDEPAIPQLPKGTERAAITDHSQVQMLHIALSLAVNSRTPMRPGAGWRR